MEGYYRIATHAISRQPLDALSQRSFHALPRDAAPQLPALHRRTTYVVSRNVDADDRAVVAGLQTDRFGGVAGNLWICEPAALVVSLLARPIDWRPLQPAPRRDHNTKRFDGPRACAGGINTDGRVARLAMAVGGYLHYVPSGSSEC